MADDRIESDWVRGSLPLLVLMTLSVESAHGYAITRRLVAAELGPIKGGTLYPVLNRLEADGSIEAEWVPGEGGPGRKIFAITAAGRERLAGLLTRWSHHVERVAGLQDDTGGSAT
ncbi:PadR family transcriptional regulator [Aeromicrobium stalagmiti]|uniref:PadR family transcriptional regulator n=1 Tax=Aeromicrobium stalagmiti TaxID=2738988 RepID=UPI0015687174|nr:helix-turn-helix transcriptional regulator [Aeromicrobium stalagmiti]NRQ51627.1 helix-turn-helix transcriptional regulator [Aeromicrobium stalagmiti]